MNLYGLLDAARDPRIYNLIKAVPDHACLFGGKLEYPLDHVAPYLVQLTEDSELVHAWRMHGWGESWGILCYSHAGLRDVRAHLRKFLQARLSDGRVVLFRFYDPRVWRTYIETCESAEIAPFFGLVELYRAETADGLATLQYAFRDGSLSVMTLGNVAR